MGITVSNAAMLAHCHALTQACGYTEGEEDKTNYLSSTHTSFHPAFFSIIYSFS